MKKLFFLLPVLVIASLNSFSQDYKAAVGVRGGWTSGLTGKYIIKEGMAIEGILSTGYRYHGGQIVGLFEIYKPAFAKDDVEGLFWYYGGGAHFGAGYSYTIYHPSPGWGYGHYEEHNYVAFGIDAIFGMEYKIPDIPFAVSADVKPYIDFVTDRDAPFGFWDSGISIRYLFGGGE